MPKKYKTTTSTTSATSTVSTVSMPVQDSVMTQEPVNLDEAKTITSTTNDVNVNADTLLNFLSDEHKKLLDSIEFTDKLTIYCKDWTIEECSAKPNSLFVFGDNDEKKGLGGQAVIRPCKNSIGIPTKKRPTNHVYSFYNDGEYDASCKKIQQAIIAIINESSKYEEIVFPMGGFGTGLAKLEEKAPKTFKYLNDVICGCFNIDYNDILKNGLQIEFNI